MCRQPFMIKPTILALAVFIIPIFVFCQSDSLKKTNHISQMDVRDWFVKKGWNKKIVGKNDKFLFVIPVLGANPANGFFYGAGLTYIYKPKSAIRFSTLSSNASYSTKESLNMNVRTNLYLLRDKLFLNGDWQYFIFTEATYGLGASPNNLSQSLEYHHIRIHETASWKLFKNFFVGAGFQYDQYFNIQDDSINISNPNNSYYYSYNKIHDFDPNTTTLSGASLNLLFDNRDNTVNSYKGYYANLNYRINTTDLGSSKNSSILIADMRSFYPLDAKKRHILALWLYGSFILSGNVPYLSLPALGYDQRQRTGRGYAFGRLRGEDFLYAESEYRFPISPKSNILGGVLFVNLSSTSNRVNNVSLLNYTWAAYGAGLRVMLDKQSRTRLDFDVAMGSKIGFYVGIRETF